VPKPNPNSADQLGHTLGELLDQVVVEVWSSHLGLPVERSSAAGPDPARALSGVIGIHGAWDGRVVLTCSDELARQAAVELFGTEPSTPGELLDLVGEVTNITGGNLAGLLPGLTTMTVPVVEPGPGPAHDRPRATYAYGEQTFTVALIPSEPMENR
jgi:chemotaxis protein CheX